jgi:hypothetical protein
MLHSGARLFWRIPRMIFNLKEVPNGETGARGSVA